MIQESIFILYHLERKKGDNKKVANSVLCTQGFFLGGKNAKPWYVEKSLTCSVETLLDCTIVAALLWVEVLFNLLKQELYN